ncbi:protein S-acyltransferase 10-like isoform X2 [Punica granatum]|uniref:S-acyltransferase n=1 Tax=Punica granatum TaxID=22663 RepID=A0A6P8DA41_PUNGR|nr:protein S-acyltransferase 10-like isoform X2 [Punica granatum]
MAFTDLCRQTCIRASDRCYRYFPCLADPARRSSLCLKVALVILHLVYVGVLFLFDKDLIDKTRKDPWYTSLYLLLFIATLVQYFITACSSPGYVLDAMRAVNEANSLFTNRYKAASNKDGSFVVTIDDPSRRNLLGNTSTSWSKTVVELYLPGTPARNYICSYCNIEQPPRSKHCHDCDRCILKFDHHCTWLGTCIGYRNHCRFWWYLSEEAALCLWTAFLYISYLHTNIYRVWWKSAIMIILLIFLSISLIFLLLLLLFHSYLILTNQTTYELVRRQRITYLSHVPRRLCAFSRGMGRNLYYICCGGSSYLEQVPTQHELEERSRPYTCLDTLTCRCCF